jgi:hypothetical protein
MSAAYRALIAVVVALPCALAVAEAPTPPALSTKVSADDLVALAKKYVDELTKAVADEKTWATDGKKISCDANSLAMISLVLAKHDSKHALKGTAAALIAPAQKVAKAKDLATAQAGVASLKELMDNEPLFGGEPEWSKVASLGRVMEQVGNVNTKLRNSLKRLDARRMDDNAQAATFMAAVGQAIVFDTHEVKNPADLPKWYAMSDEMRDAAGELSKAIRAGDKDAASAASTRVMKNCDACHEVFGQ